MVCRFLSALIFSFFLIAPATAQTDAEGTQVRCYQFSLPDGTEVSEMNAKPSTQTWCYQKNQGETFVFNADAMEVKPELSFHVDSDGIMTHGSLMDGQVTYHKVDAKAYNPFFNIPVNEPTDRAAVPMPRMAMHSVQNVKTALENSEVSLFTPFAMREGEASAFAAASGSSVKKPWRGNWWSYKAASMVPRLAKYDRFVRARGLSSNAAGWERSNHRYSGVWWEGHCNGWAASSILRSEPRTTKRDPRSGVTFTVDDQKAILAETDYCAHVSFHGDRYRGNGDNRRDIFPANFHKTITYYIGQLRKPVIIDYRSDSAVDNHPVSAYRMNIVKTGSNTYTVTAVLTFHKYDSGTGKGTGIAPSYTRTYKYTLREDSDGDIVGGSWLSANPDFIWVPLSIKDCSKNNPHIRFDLVADILSLPSTSVSVW